MSAYYNEHDPNAAAWLRELIKHGHIADGEVDSRSIVDVRSDDLDGFTQCHFFAGIGVWSYALRLAGWSDDRSVWTGSCPCQPFSAAGKREGFNDERHLWPHFHRLIAECRPPVVLGEQVASKDGLNWLDTVFADLEGSGYAAGAADLPACGLGAPHIRQRLWFVGKRLDDTAGARRDGALARPEGDPRDESRLRLSGEGGGPGSVADAASGGRQHEPHEQSAGVFQQEASHPLAGAEPRGHSASSGRLGHDDDEGLEGQRGGHPAEGGRLGAVRPAAAASEPRGLADAEHDDRRADVEGRRPDRRATDGGSGAALRMADTAGSGHQPRERDSRICDANAGADAATVERGPVRAVDEPSLPGPVNGHWRDADWLYCRDGRFRPVEPGTFPLVDGASEKLVRSRDPGAPIDAGKTAEARVMRLRGYGNAIVPHVAAEFIQAVM